MDKKMFDGREMAVVFAEEKRKTPEQMRREQYAPRCPVWAKPSLNTQYIYSTLRRENVDQVEIDAL